MSTPDTPPEAHDDAHPADADAGTPTAARQAGTPGPQPTEPAPVTGAQRALGRALGRPRPHGRIAVGLAVLAAVAIVLVPVGLAGLHGGSAADGAGATATAIATPTPVSADGPLEDVLTVVGRVGAVPVVALRGPLTAATAVRSDVLTEGSGRRIATGDAVLLSVATFSGLTGENTTGTEAGTRLYRGLLEEKGLGTDLAPALDGPTEGSRVVLRAPAVSTDGSASTEITVVDVLPALSQGEERDAPAGAPKVSVDAGGVMSIDVSGTKAPSSSTASTLIEGTGRQVTAKDRVIALGRAPALLDIRRHGRPRRHRHAQHAGRSRPLPRRRPRRLARPPAPHGGPGPWRRARHRRHRRPRGRRRRPAARGDSHTERPGDERTDGGLGRRRDAPAGRRHERRAVRSPEQDREHVTEPHGSLSGAPLSPRARRRPAPSPGASRSPPYATPATPRAPGPARPRRPSRSRRERRCGPGAGQWER